ncbi:MAG: hypothetical protein ABSB49_05750 [Polyangia bacterium]|jgi:hypothetical protein
MKAEQLTEILETAATQLGIKVRYEALAAAGPTGGGGLCRVRGDWCVIIDKKTAPSERASILTDALAGMDTDAIFLPPKVRELLAQRRASNQRTAQ